jgi:hypothetical protein
MKERPIIFSAPMVKAILPGRKTMTRRIVKKNASGRVELGGKNWHVDDPNAVAACPYGKVGDRLWVREVWREFTNSQGAVVAIEYRADESNDDFFKWKSPLFMPRWASRITLELTEVRIERLQDITAGDCVKEGVYPHDVGDDFHAAITAIAAFRNLWDSLYPDKPAKRWESNPWVWVLEFKRIK